SILLDRYDVALRRIAFLIRRNRTRVDHGGTELKSRHCELVIARDLEVVVENAEIDHLARLNRGRRTGRSTERVGQVRAVHVAYQAHDLSDRGPERTLRAHAHVMLTH